MSDDLIRRVLGTACMGAGQAAMPAIGFMIIGCIDCGMPLRRNIIIIYATE